MVSGMSEVLFPFSRAELSEGLNPVAAAALAGAYEPLAEAAAKQVADGFPDARHLAVVRVMVDATLGVLAQPEVRQRLPLEITDRAVAAEECARTLAGVACRSKLFVNMYKLSPALGPLLASNTERDLTSEVFVGTNGINPFFETSVTAGGAYKLLRRGQITEPAAAVIGRSTSLLATSRADRDQLDRVFNRLGFPYVLPGHLAIKEGPQPEVIFTSAARAIINKFCTETSGCPAAKVADPTQPIHTVLTEAWERIVHFLVPENATTRTPNSKFPGYEAYPAAGQPSPAAVRTPRPDWLRAG
jgi:hypothetical protein